MRQILTDLLNVRLSDTAPFPIWVSSGPIYAYVLNEIYWLCRMKTRMHTFQCYSDGLPFSPSLFLSIDLITSSGTVTRPSGVLIGSTLTGSQLIGTYYYWFCGNIICQNKCLMLFMHFTWAASKIFITASDISGPMPSPLINVTHYWI